MKAAELIRDSRQRPVRFVAPERQHARIEHTLQSAFVRLLGSSASTRGVEVERFEAEFAAFCEVAHCVGVASGTAALTLTLEAYRIGPGDEVIVPAHTCMASLLAVDHVGAMPVLCDVEEGNGLIDPDAARAAVGPRTAAVLAVHLYGQVCNMAAIEAFAKPAGLLVLEDAAHAPGVRYCGHRAGSLGAAAAFSFHPSGNLGALGDGGAVCTDDDLLAARVRRLRNLGRRSDGEYVERGYSERLDGLQAALLRVKLPHLEGWNQARRERAALYQEPLPEAARILEERPASPCSYHVFPVRVPDRDEVSLGLRRRRIETRIHYSPAVHGHSVWWDRPLRHGRLPAAEAWAAEELSLPMHPDLLPDEIEWVAQAVHVAMSPSISHSSQTAGRYDLPGPC